MSEPDPLVLLLDRFNALHLDYMITGGVAAIAYGEPRVTHDVDVVIAFRSGDAERLAGAFAGEEFYVPPLEVIRTESGRPRHGHFNLVHRPSAFKADVYPVGDDPMHHWAWPRRWRGTLLGRDVWMAPLEYVILRKLQYYRDGGSERHLRDVGAMLRISGEMIDRAGLEGQVRQYGLESEWARVPESRPR